MTLCRYLEEMNRLHPECFKDKKVIDLGSGTGLAAILLSSLGKIRFYSFAGSKVIATDQKEEVKLLKKNIQLNRELYRGSITCQELNW